MCETILHHGDCVFHGSLTRRVTIYYEQLRSGTSASLVPFPSPWCFLTQSWSMKWPVKLVGDPVVPVQPSVVKDHGKPAFSGPMRDFYLTHNLVMDFRYLLSAVKLFSFQSILWMKSSHNALKANIRDRCTRLIVGNNRFCNKLIYMFWLSLSLKDVHDGMKLMIPAEFQTDSCSALWRVLRWDHHQFFHRTSSVDHVFTLPVGDGGK